MAPARARAEVWRTLLGLCLMLAIYSGFGLAAFAVAERIWGPISMTGETPWSMTFFLVTFLGMAAAPILVARLLHRRRIGSLFGRAAWVLRDFALAVGIAGAIFGAAVGLWLIWFDPLPGLDPRLWLSFLPLALLGLLIQTGAEELVFRGYLQQQLAARFVSPLAWMVTPSLLFGFAHYDPVMSGDNGWAIVVATATFAVFAADLTARTGSIGAAWGLHFINNVVAILLIGVDGALDGLSLFVTPYAMDAPVLRWLILFDTASLMLTWLVLRRVLSR